MLVSDGGTVTCNGRDPVPLEADRLLAARELARDLETQAALGIDLPAEGKAGLRYRVTLEQGEIAFADTSKGRPGSFDRLVAFTTDVAENVCGIER